MNREQFLSKALKPIKVTDIPNFDELYLLPLSYKTVMAIGQEKDPTLKHARAIVGSVCNEHGVLILNQDDAEKVANYFELDDVINLSNKIYSLNKVGDDQTVKKSEA